MDLTSGKTETVPTSNYVPKFIGGRALAAKLYWDEVPPTCSALDPEIASSLRPARQVEHWGGFVEDCYHDKGIGHDARMLYVLRDRRTLGSGAQVRWV